MAIGNKTKLIQVKINGEWKWLFCRNEDSGLPVTTENYKKAQKAQGFYYFEKHFAEEVRIIRPIDTQE